MSALYHAVSRDILNRPAFGFVDALLSKGGLFFERDRTDIFDSRGSRKCDQGLALNHHQPADRANRAEQDAESRWDHLFDRDGRTDSIAGPDRHPESQALRHV